MERVRERLALVVPLTLFLIFLLLYLNTKSLVKTAIVALAVPFSAIGAIWLVYLLGYNMSIAVWVGLIALLGVDAAVDDVELRGVRVAALVEDHAPVELGDRDHEARNNFV